MRKFYPILLGFLAGIFLGSCSQEEEQNPKLVVLIGIDQFGSEYLGRFHDAYSGGFKRLLEEGRVYPNAEVDHAPTLTWPGFTALSTGTYPKHNGVPSHRVYQTIPANDLEGTFITRDRNEKIIGFPEVPGQSPRGIQISGLFDWVLKNNPLSKSVVLSSSQSGVASLFVSKTDYQSENGHAYWPYMAGGEFVTSTFYRDSLPDWVVAFNQKHMPSLLAVDVWDLTVPGQFLHLARRDEAFYEEDGTHVTFPHKFKEEGLQEGEEFTPEEEKSFQNRWVFRTPQSTDILFALATEAVTNLGLGQDAAVDFLALNIEVTDRIGHHFGPKSLEQMDNILRLDKALGEFLTFLDQKIGRGNYILAISADHGAPNIVEYELENGRQAKRIQPEEMEALLDKVDAVVLSHEGSPESLPEKIAVTLETSPFIARAFTPADFAGEETTDDLLRVYRNAYNPNIAWNYPLWDLDYLETGKIRETHPVRYGVIVELERNAQIWTARSAHGGGYDYDRNVPVIFFGSGITPGTLNETIRTIDVVPTLANLSGIKVPEEIDGKILDVTK